MALALRGGATFLAPVMSSHRASVFRAAALERLSSPEQLDERMRVVSPRAWLTLAALGLLLAGVIGWSLLGHVAIKVHGRGQFVAAGRAAVILVPASDVRRVQVGMPVQIVPATYSANEDGFVRGTVVAVGSQPASRAELLALVGDEDQVRRIGEAPFAVEVAVADPSVAAGVPCTGRIIVSNRRPIALVLPTAARGARP
jgi:hypothetical protein